MEVGSIFELSVSLGPGGPYFQGITVRGGGGGGGGGPKIALDRNAYDTGFRKRKAHLPCMVNTTVQCIVNVKLNIGACQQSCVSES